MIKLPTNPSLVGFLIAVVAQLVLAPNLMIFGVAPDFLLIYVFILALNYSDRGLLWYAFAAGYLFDLLGVGPLGAMAFVFMVVSFLLRRVYHVLNNDTFFVPLFLIVIASVLTEFLYALFLFFTGNLNDFWVGIALRALPAAVMNAVLCLLLLPLLSRFMKSKSKSDEALPLTRIRS